MLLTSMHCHKRQHTACFSVGKSGSPLCSLCNVKDENPYHLFYECSHTVSLQNQLRYFLSNSLNIPLLTPQSAIFGFINQKENFLIINHLLFIFKFYIYSSRSSSKLNIEYLKTIIYRTRSIELEVIKTETIRNENYINKWQPIPVTQSKQCKGQEVGFFYFLLFYLFIFFLLFLFF